MSKRILGIIVVIIIIISSVAAYWYTQKKEEKKPVMIVKIGDLVEVNYTGRFTNGTVFDTNIESVANDENISKSYSFKPKTIYSPLKFTVGGGQMIKGFDEGVLNMTVGETKIINVTAEDGYGMPHEDLFIVINKTQSVPLVETITKDKYDNHYSENLIEGIPIPMTHYFWGWKITAEKNGDNVTIRNWPDMNSTINVFGWNSTITERDSSYNGGEGRILLQHFPDENITINMEKTGFLAKDIDSQSINEALSNIITQATLFYNSSVSDMGIVSSVDTDTFTIDYNPEVVGKTLIFEVTIISISRG